MSVAGTPRWSLRLERAETSRLAWAFALSLALHLLVFGTYQTGQKYHIWQNLHLPTWLHVPKVLQEVFKKKETPLQPRPQDVPLVFVNVSPAQATPEPPKEAKFYSDKNSIAANHEADKITDIPKITGTQTLVPKTEDVPREKFAPLQPTRPVEPPQVAQEEVMTKPLQSPGDLVMAKPAPTPRTTEGNANEAKPSRPRKLSQVPVEQREAMLRGEKMQQEGGVRRRELVPSFDTRATPFGAYDAALVEAVSKRWWALLDEREYASDSRGKVVLQFHLHYDGRITEMNMADNTAGEVLGFICQKAVLDNAPYAAWPSDMRRLLGDTRSIQFTFYYY